MRAVLVFAVLLAACDDPAARSPEEKTVDLLNEMAAIVETIRDKATAEAAAQKLEPLYERGRALQQEMEGRAEQASAATRRAFDEAEARMAKAMREALKIPGVSDVLHRIRKN